MTMLYKNLYDVFCTDIMRFWQIDRTNLAHTKTLPDPLRVVRGDLLVEFPRRLVPHFPDQYRCLYPSSWSSSCARTRLALPEDEKQRCTVQIIAI